MAITSLPSGKTIKTQVFTSSGSWVAPAGVASVEVLAVGGGGGSGRVNASTGASGGGGGGALRARLTHLFAAASCDALTFGRNVAVQTGLCHYFLPFRAANASVS